MPTKRSSRPAAGQPQTPPPASLPTGRLILSGLTAFGYHGNNPAERKLGQTFSVDLEVTLDTQRAAATDRIDDTISYPALEKLARGVLEGKPANLLETVAERIAAAVLEQPRVVQVTVRVSKRPPLPNLSRFTVEITRPVETRDLAQ
jgi:dihydroneopterin aldolase / 2-amino-4-hydroxy-6-hydroxymethyldihydropteridine diphosphokinase